jgi:hypothetical protein
MPKRGIDIHDAGGAPLNFVALSALLDSEPWPTSLEDENPESRMEIGISTARLFTDGEYTCEDIEEENNLRRILGLPSFHPGNEEVIAEPIFKLNVGHAACVQVRTYPTETRALITGVRLPVGGEGWIQEDNPEPNLSIPVVPEFGPPEYNMLAHCNVQGLPYSSSPFDYRLRCEERGNILEVYPHGTVPTQLRGDLKVKISPCSSGGAPITTILFKRSGTGPEPISYLERFRRRLEDIPSFTRLLLELRDDTREPEESNTYRVLLDFVLRISLGSPGPGQTLGTIVCRENIFVYIRKSSDYWAKCLLIPGGPFIPILERWHEQLFRHVEVFDLPEEYQTYRITGDTLDRLALVTSSGRIVGAPVGVQGYGLGLHRKAGIPAAPVRDPGGVRERAVSSDSPIEGIDWSAVSSQRQADSASISYW